MGTLPLAAINMDMVIGIIAVVGWIIAQALSRKGTPTATPPPHPGTGAGGHAPNPNDELKKFFENLEKGLTGQTEQAARAEAFAPPPPPPPRARQHAPRARRVPAASPTAPQSTLDAGSLAGLQDVTLPAVETESAQRWSKPRHKWALGYTNPETLQKMIIASEVLGVPLALRKPKSTPF